jgi:hypothetical protein
MSKRDFINYIPALINTGLVLFSGWAAEKEKDYGFMVLFHRSEYFEWTIKSP